MDERLRFVARLLEGEKRAPVCRGFGISHVTGYKIFDPYKACGLHGLYDRSHVQRRARSSQRSAPLANVGDLLGTHGRAHPANFLGFVQLAALSILLKQF